MPCPAVVASEPVRFLMVPPLPSLDSDPLVPLTVKLPVAREELFHRIPFDPPFADTEMKLKVPSELTRLTATADVVLTVVSLTARPVDVPAATMPCEEDGG